MYAEIFSTVKELHLEKFVFFLGYVRHKDLPALYNAAEIFVYVPFYEGFGLPVLEAMQCGPPVITSNTSSLPGLVGENGTMVHPQDIRQLAHEMIRILENDQVRQDNIRNRLSQSPHFSWERCARKTAQVYLDVYEKFS